MFRFFEIHSRIYFFLDYIIYNTSESEIFWRNEDVSGLWLRGRLRGDVLCF